MSLSHRAAAAEPGTIPTVAGTIPTVGSQAKDFDLEALSGGTLTLSKLTTEGPVALVVLRGYPGYRCPYCTKQFASFLSKADDFKKLGAQVVFVYPGDASELKTHATEFVRGKDYPDDFHLVLDPDYSFVDTYGLRWIGKKETAYPSTFVLDQTRIVTFAKVSKTHGNRASVADVLLAISAISHPATTAPSEK